MKLRACGGVLVALALILVPSQASACTLEGFAVTPSAGPNDPVGWSIGGMTPGASYSVTFSGQTQSGEAGQNGNASGAFTMPDLGEDGQTVYVTAVVTHPATADDPGDWPLSKPVQYVAPPAPAKPREPNSVESPTGRTPRHHPDPGVQQQGETRAHPDSETGSPATGGGSTPISTSLSPDLSSPASAPSVAPASASAEESAPESIVRSLQGSSDVGPLSVPHLAIGALALIFLLGTALAVFAVYLLSHGPDPQAAIRSPAPPGPDPLETELQELLAEEMARALLGELSVDGDAAVASAGGGQPLEDSSAARISSP